MKAGRTQDVDDSQERLDLLQAAEAWHRSRIVKSTIKDLHINYKLLSKFNHTVPFCNRLIYTKRIACESQRGEDVGKWFTCIWPFTQTVPAPLWEFDGPSFSSLVTEILAGDNKSYLTDLHGGDSFGQVWQSCILNDNFLAWMDDESKHPLLFEMVSTYLTEFDKGHNDQELPEFLSVAWMEVHKVFLGLAALLSPKPNIFGSDTEDVAWLRDAGTTGTLNDSTIKAKKSILKRIQRSPFSLLVTEFRKTESVVAEYGSTMVDLESRLQVLKEADFEDEDEPIEILEKFVTNIKSWQKDLRKGATDDIETLVLDLLTHKVSSISDRLVAEKSPAKRALLVKSLEQVSPILKLLGPSLARGMQDTLQRAMNLKETWSAKDQAASLESMATESKFDLIDEVHGCSTTPHATHSVMQKESHLVLG